MLLYKTLNKGLYMNSYKLHISLFALFALNLSAFAGSGCKDLFNDFIKETKVSKKSRSSKIPLDWYKDYSSETIGELIAKRLHRESEFQNESLNVKDGFDYRAKGVKMALAIRDNDLREVLNEGVFLNMHQTGRTNGESLISQRVAQENQLSTLELGDDSQAEIAKDISAKIKEVRPKSAYLFLGDIKESKYLGETNVRMQYGDVFAVLKNHIKDRSLFTQHDSLASGKAYSFDIKPEAPLPATPDMMGDYSAYYEALVFGRLGTDDVDYWLYDVSDMGKAEMRELIESEGTTLHKLLKAGMKVYKAKHVNNNGRREVVKGAKIKL